MNRSIRNLMTVVPVGLLLLAGCPATAPDIYEPNETLAGFSPLGTVAVAPSESSWSATISPTGDLDFYGITAPDPSSLGFPGDPETLTLTIRLEPPQTPAGMNYDLYLYNVSGIVLDSSTNPEAAGEEILYTWGGTVGLGDSRDFRVEVRGAGGASGSSPYTLSADLLETLP